jgi:hypothetical protein
MAALLQLRVVLAGCSAGYRVSTAGGQWSGVALNSQALDLFVVTSLVSVPEANDADDSHNTFIPAPLPLQVPE